MPRKKLGIAIAASILFLGATAYKAVTNEFGRFDREEAYAIVSSDSAQAKRDGVLVAKLFVDSLNVTLPSGEIVIQEAWIERYAVHRYPLVWFRKRVPVGGFVIAVRLAPTSPSDLFFWLDKSGSGFAQSWYFHSKFVEREPTFPLTISISVGREHVPAFVLRKSEARGDS